MELTKECLEEIAFRAKEVDNGRLVITIQSRPEDQKSFDLKCEYEMRFRVSRDGCSVQPTEPLPWDYPTDKYEKGA